MPKTVPQLAKLSRPRLYDPVPRERLFSRLDALHRFPFVWLSGPPGSGKTSLVSSWLDARKLRFVWYQVDSSDTEPATSFSFLIELARHGARRGKSLPHFAPDHVSDLPAFARRFFRELSGRLPGGSVLVFDNCQEAAVPSFHAILEQGSAQLPEGMTLIAISRMQVPPELTRLHANRTLGTLNWDDLRLTHDEGAAILKRAQVADGASVTDLLAQADGWAAGLVLLAANSRNSMKGSTRADLSTRESLFAYFAGEVFAGASPAHREILMRTALLPEISTQSAIELSGDPAAGILLEQLYRRQYFTDRRTEPELCYRYHDLFREFLIARAEQTYSSTRWNELVRDAAKHLVAKSLFEPAVELYRRVSAWSEIAGIIEVRAEALMRQGRWQTLLGWLQMLPQPHLEKSPWLLYWHGMADQVTDVARARPVLEKAVRLFAQERNRSGEALAISAVIDGYFQEWNTVVTLNPWLDALCRLLSESACQLGQPYLLRIQTSLLIGLLFRRPGDPALIECVRAVTAGMAEEANPSERLRMMVYLVLYHDLMGSFSSARELIAQIGSATTRQDISPRVRVWAIFRFAHHYMNAGEDDLALEEIEKALRISRDEGVHTLSAFLLIGHAMILFNAGRGAVAQEVLKEAAPLLKASRPMELVFYRWTEFSTAVATDDLALASSLWDAFAAMPLIGVPHNLAYNHAVIFLLVQRGAIADAESRIRGWREALVDMGSPCLKYNLDVMEAYVRLQQRDSVAVDLIRSVFSAAASRGFFGMLCWLPRMMRPLCAVALKEGIEPDFVARLIRRKRLRAAGEPIHWVWPVMVYTLGRFAVFRDRDPIRFTHRPQHKPLELLQAIIAAGEAGASTRQLASRLWPDSEGDAGINALNAALHRLRKLLGDEASLVLNHSRVALNPEICWVDALAFDRAATVALSEPTSVRESAEVLRLYRGHFLGEDVDSPWKLAFRDRLRAKFQRLTLAVGARLEEQSQWRLAADLYRGALEVDNVQEEAYRRLMICLRELGEIAEAKQAYRRCRELLSIVLGVHPSPETTAVYQSLRG